MFELVAYEMACHRLLRYRCVLQIFQASELDVLTHMFSVVDMLVGLSQSVFLQMVRCRFSVYKVVSTCLTCEGVSTTRRRQVH